MEQVIFEFSAILSAITYIFCILALLTVNFGVLLGMIRYQRSEIRDIKVIIEAKGIRRLIEYAGNVDLEESSR